MIVKIHGAVDRSGAEDDSYVITEDHYIDYLTRSDIASLLPVAVAAQAASVSHFLFLGYGMRDWNLRVILHRIWGAQTRNYASWAIQFGSRPDREDVLAASARSRSWTSRSTSTWPGWRLRSSSRSEPASRRERGRRRATAGTPCRARRTRA